MYWDNVSSGRALYDVVEADSEGRYSLSFPVAPDSAPADWDSMKSYSWIEEEIEEGLTATTYWLDGNTWAPWYSSYCDWDGCSGISCADYVIYTKYPEGANFARIARDSLEAQGLAVRAFASTSPSVTGARGLLSCVISMNAICNGDEDCRATPYPVSPGPTLLVLGDANPQFIYPAQIPTGVANVYRHSYVLGADLDNDSIPDCPVEVVPGSTTTEIRTMVDAGADYNRGLFVDAGRHVVLVAGDYTSGAGGIVGAAKWVKDFFGRTDTLYTVHGMWRCPESCGKRKWRRLQVLSQHRSIRTTGGLRHGASYHEVGAVADHGV